MRGKYDDILHLPHSTSKKYPRMSKENRAAQFSPFAALTGHESAIGETARFTDLSVELGEDIIDILDRKLNILNENVSAGPNINVTFFKPDNKKEGGKYITVSDTLKKIDNYEHTILLANGTVIPIKDILDIDCELFKSFL